MATIKVVLTQTEIYEALKSYATSRLGNKNLIAGRVIIEQDDAKNTLTATVEFTESRPSIYER